MHRKFFCMIIIVLILATLYEIPEQGRDSLSPINEEHKYRATPPNPNFSLKTRSMPLVDLDEFGGSWFSNLENDGTELLHEIVIRNGSAQLEDGGTFAGYTAVGGLASSQVQGGKYPVTATFDKMWPSCNGANPCNGDFNRSATHPRPAYSGNPNRLHWKPTDTDWGDGGSWFYQDYGQAVTFNGLSNSIENDGRTNTYSVEVSNWDSGPWTEIIPSGARQYVTTFRFPDVTARYVKVIYTAVSTGVPYCGEIEIWKYSDYAQSGNITSEIIEIPSSGHNWSSLSLNKAEPANTYVNISVLNATTLLPITGFENLTGSHIDISDIIAEAIRIRGWFEGNGSVTPSLGSWGVEWGAPNAWRDGFTGRGKCLECNDLNISGKVELNESSISGILKSVPVELPQNCSWSTLHFNRTVPLGTYLNISIHDAGTDELLYTDTNRTEESQWNMSGINSSLHASIYLRGEFRSTGGTSPVLRSWSLNWSPTEEELFPVSLLKFLPDRLNVTEDTPEDNIIDLADYFLVPDAEISPPIYSLESVSDTRNLTLSLNGSTLDMIEIAENWTGSCTVIANCSRASGSYCTTNAFNISVIPVNDIPQWTSPLPEIRLSEDTEYVTDYSLMEYSVDAEGDVLSFDVSCSDENISVSLTDEKRISISPTRDHFGDAAITAEVSDGDVANHSIAHVAVSVIPVDDAPWVELMYPSKGMKMPDGNVTLEWTMEDPDTPPSNVYFDLYFGVEAKPPAYDTEVRTRNYVMTDLEEGITYYWYVLPHDGNRSGNCTSGIWSFSISNISAEVPEVSYSKPPPGSDWNSENITLEWISHNTSFDGLKYDVYLGDSKDALERIDTTDRAEYDISGLLNGTTYYWKIVPHTDNLTGKTRSDIWNFTVKLDSNPVFNISYSLDKDRPVLVKGTRKLFLNLTITNTGNNPNAVTVSIGGVLRDRGIIDPEPVEIPVGGQERIEIEVYTGDLEAGTYILLIKLRFTGGPVLIDIPVNITEKTKPDPPATPGEEKKNEGSGMGYVLWIGIIGLVFLILLFFIFYRRRKKKRDTEKDDEEVPAETPNVDIVHVPSPGHVKVTSMPHLAGTGETSPYQFKGRSAGPGTTGGSAGSGDEAKPATGDDFDISKIHIPDTSEMKIPYAPKDDKPLALPEARYLKIDPEEQKVPIEEIFLMTPDGLMLDHYTLERENEIDDDIMAGMLSAVTSFIVDSLTMMGKKDVMEGDMGIEMGDYTIMVSSGDNMNLVAITSSDKKDNVRKQLEKGLDVIEDSFGEVLVDWDGDMSKLEGVKPYIESLVKGELDDLISTKQLTSGLVPDKIQLSETTDSLGGRKFLTEKSETEDKIPTWDAGASSVPSTGEDTPVNEEPAQLEERSEKDVSPSPLPQKKEDSGEKSGGEKTLETPPPPES